jgi:HAD superfamily phosphatase
MNQPTGILVFDMDGVLVDVTESYRETIARTAEHFIGRPVGREAIQEYKNQGGWNDDWRLSHHIVRAAGVEALFEEVKAHFQRLFLGENGAAGLILRERWIARPGVLEDLSRRFRLALFTGRPKEEAQLTLSRFAPHLVFDPIVAMEDVERPKPAPDGLLQILRQSVPVPDQSLPLAAPVHPSRDRKGVPMDLQPTGGDEGSHTEVGRTPWSAAGPLAGLRPEADEGVGRGPGGPPHLGDRVFRGMPMGLRPAEGDEYAAGRRHGIDGSDCVFGGAAFYIGDTIDDARAARAAGVPFIGIAAPDNPLRAGLVSLFQSEGAVAILPDINQLPEVFPK